MTDPELIKKIIAGEKNLYRFLVEKYQERVFRVCMGFVHNKEDADDISQEVFINAFLSLQTFHGKAEFSTWLHRITVNTCLNHIRKNKKGSFLRRISFPAENKDHRDITIQPEVSPEADQSLIEEEKTKIVKDAINHLPGKQRIAFILSNYEDLPQKEIAAIMNKSEGAIEQLLQRAKTNLQKKLAVHYRNFQS